MPDVTDLDGLVEWLEPQPSAAALPARVPNPFLDAPPHPIARDAALRVQEALKTGQIAPGVSTAVLDGRREGGKMFGVLVARDPNGRIGVFKGYSGQIGWQWTLPGWVPPAFDEAARAVAETASDVLVKALTRQVNAIAASDVRRAAAENLARTDRAAAEARYELRYQQALRRQARRAARRQLAPDDPARERFAHEPGAEERERAELEAHLQTLREGPARAEYEQLFRERAVANLRAAVSRDSMRRIQATYVFTNSRGVTRPLQALFPEGMPPWGAGDCAAPKLLACAIAHEFRPIALAEFWWGPPPPGGGRTSGEFSPACRPKCGPILPFLLDGFDVEPPIAPEP